MVFVDKRNLPLLAWVNLSVRYLLNRIFEQVITSDFNLLRFSFIAIVILSLDSHTALSEELGTDVKIIHPRYITDEMFTNDVWDLSEVHINTMLFQLFVNDPEIITEKFQALISADES